MRRRIVLSWLGVVALLGIVALSAAAVPIISSVQGTQHCGCAAGQNDCTMPCSMCCAPVCTWTDPTCAACEGGR